MLLGSLRLLSKKFIKHSPVLHNNISQGALFRAGIIGCAASHLAGTTFVANKGCSFQACCRALQVLEIILIQPLQRVRLRRGHGGHADVVVDHQGRKPPPVDQNDALCISSTYSRASLVNIEVVIKTPRMACFFVRLPENFMTSGRPTTSFHLFA